MCQDENENEPEEESSRLFVSALSPERTKALVFVFVLVFVLAHEKGISANIPMKKSQVFIVNGLCIQRKHIKPPTTLVNHFVKPEIELQYSDKI